MTEKIPGWLERALLPRLSEMSGEIRGIHTRIDALDEKLSTKIGEMDKRLTDNDRHLTDKIGELDKRLSSNDTHLADKIDGLDKKLDVVQRLTVLETKMEELQPKA